MDGNTAAAHVAYAFTDVAAIYPITPSSVMAELCDDWAANGRENIFGQRLKIAEMQSEGGAAGAVHGSLAAGALTTTFTASQGLLLMIPNMYKIAAEQLPGVIHVSARALATHALSIFGDHSDVMACRGTGFAMLASSNPQEVMDLAAVTHLSAIEGHHPFVHFFDGFRTSHEIQKIAVWDYEELKEMLNMDEVAKFRANALSPEHPVLRGSAQNPDIFFQVREASNGHVADIVDVVVANMNKVNARIGTNYKPFNYYGAPDATSVIVSMGSSCDAIEEVVDYLNERGEKVGLVNVHLYRPFSAKHLVDVLPESVQRIAVLDRCKEPGALGEPLYQDVVTALAGTKFGNVPVIGGRYGLGSKDTGPSCYLAVFRNLAKENPQHPFTIGITDDVTNLSLPTDEVIDTQAKGNTACKFWGLGSDGTVGANKNSIKIIGDNTDLKIQAYFQYDSKKSGGVTISHLRFGPEPIRSTYYVTASDFVACHQASYLEKYPMAQDLKPGGTFLINCGYDVEQLGKVLPADAKRYIAKNNIQVYTVDAAKLGQELGLGNKFNMILQAAFFKLANIIPIDDAERYMKDAIVKTYGHKGEDVVNKNKAAVDAGLANLNKLEIPASWADAVDTGAAAGITCNDPEMKQFIDDVLVPANAMVGDAIPVSKLMKLADGTLPAGSAAYEKRGISAVAPTWLPQNCIQCNFCSYVCPHAVIRPFVMNADELAAAPEGTQSKPLTGKGVDGLNFSIQVSALDCTGCGSCVNVCPAKEKALKLVPVSNDAQKKYDYAFANVSEKELPFAANTVKGSQFRQPLFEFSGACAGCGETPYAKLVTQLFGDRMFIANATGCSSIWGGSAPSTPYTVNKKGQGPAWSNSLFEDNAEYGLGEAIAMQQRRAGLADTVRKLIAVPYCDEDIAAAAQEWLDNMDDAAGSKAAGEKLLALCKAAGERDYTGSPFEEAWLKNGKKCPCEACGYARDIVASADLLTKPSMWIFGGDGWAYDIGYGGLDHVLASGQNVNIFVFDTEVYSNTGGQSSKSTPTGAVAQFAASGKETKKKDLAQIAMTYGYVYVAQVAMGADYQQTLKAIHEAEAYDGPSLIIAYAPCINHGAKAGMSKAMETMKRAVDAGYWFLFRYDPRRENPFQLDSKAPSGSYNDYIMSEVRYSSLKLAFPERAAVLFEKAEEESKAKYEQLSRREANGGK
jgi:pyruvate-ferredoxin/flavodoxin oxidoreductase